MDMKDVIPINTDLAWAINNHGFIILREFREESGGPLSLEIVLEPKMKRPFETLKEADGKAEELLKHHKTITAWVIEVKSVHGFDCMPGL